MSGGLLAEYWRGQVGACERAILDVMIQRVGVKRTVTRDFLAQVTNYQANGGGFGNSLSRLRSLGLIEGGQNGIALGSEVGKELVVG